MRLMLVDNFVTPDGTDASLFDVHPHLGLVSLAAAALRHGHSTEIFDPKRAVRFGSCAYDRRLYRYAAERILRYAPDVVGFTTLGCSFLFAVRVAALLKQEQADLPVILGGPHATMLDRPILAAYRQFDIVVRHEAEETFPAVLARLEDRAFRDVPGVTWRDRRSGDIRSTPGLPKVEDLDSLPIASYDLYPVEELGLEVMRIEAGRGCPFACTFCSTSSFFQRDYRLKSPERIVREMDLLHARYGVSEFKLDHDLFTVNRRKVQAFCDAVQDREYRWHVSARTDCVDAELLEQMAFAGCVGLYFGIETGSQRMQKIAQKRLKLTGVNAILDQAYQLGIATTVSFITGFPDETREDLDQTLDLLGRCFQRPEFACTPQLHILMPEPGTPMFAESGGSLAYDGYAAKFNSRLLCEDDRQHILRYRELYSTYYYYPSVLDHSFYTFAVDAVEAFRSAGQDVFGYALRFFGGRLSVLMADFRRWVAEARVGCVVDGRLALDYISCKFGPASHLTSLFRFGMATGGRGSALGQPTERDLGAAFDPEATYELNPACSLLDDIHDCGSLLERIRDLPAGCEPVHPDHVGERGCFMILRHRGGITQYEVDPGAMYLLQMFGTPRSVGEAVTALHEAIDDLPATDVVFEEFVRAGVLVRSSDGSGRTRSA